ncbi:acyloxyacyl hydrolase [Neolewinella sp.]|uniref:acyloxyacyl hydrolase n=1 Tax=Neolewinella sp. TaxID=2993543 RepID=UPI003B5167D4
MLSVVPQCRVLLLLVLATIPLCGQPPALTATIQRGLILPVEPFLRGENTLGVPLRRFTTYSLKFDRHTAGTREWEVRHGRPQTGFGLTYFQLPSPEELGRPVAVYRYFRAPLGSVAGRLTLDYSAEIGLATGWRRFDLTANPFNKLFSTRSTAYIFLGIGARLPLGEHWTTYLDLGLSHFSNGNFKRPNAGLNALSLGLGVHYSPVRRSAVPHPTLPAAWKPYTEWQLYLHGGTEKNLYYPAGLPAAEQNRGLTHPLFGLGLVRSRRMSFKSSLGAGLSMWYRSGGNTEVAVTPSGRLRRLDPGFAAENLRIGVFPTYTLHFNRFAALLQAEYLLLDPTTAHGLRRFYQKVGLRYGVSERLSLAVVVGARQFSVAEFVEWRVGWNWKS